MKRGSFFLSWKGGKATGFCDGERPQASRPGGKLQKAHYLGSGERRGGFSIRQRQRGGEE